MGKHFFPRIGTRADSKITTPSIASNTVFLQPSRKPEDKKTASEENKQFDPGENGEEPPPWKAGAPVFVSFLGELWAWMPAACVLFFFVFVCLSVVYCSHQVIIFQRAEENLGGEKKTNEERNRRASIFLPFNHLKMAKIKISRFDVSQCFGDRIDLPYTRYNYSWILS